MNEKKLKTGNIRDPYQKIDKIFFKVMENNGIVDEVEIRINNEYPATVIPKRDRKNCKLGSIEGIQSLINLALRRACDPKTIKDVINQIINDHVNRVIVYITVTGKEQMEFIKRNFKCFFIVMMPFGDDTGSQYHIGMINEEAMSSTIRNAMNASSVVNIHTFEEKDSFKVPEKESWHKVEGRMFGVAELEAARQRLRVGERIARGEIGRRDVPDPFEPNEDELDAL